MTTNIDENIKSFRQIYSDCSDIKMQEMYLGRDASIKCFVAYIEVTCAGSGINNSAFGRFRSEERRVGKECRSRWSPYH